jgi:GNAT superfamily N-acetyltransferase
VNLTQENNPSCGGYALLLIQNATTNDAAALVAVQVAAFHHDSEIYPGIAMGGPPGYDSVAVMRQKIEQDESYIIRHKGQCIGGLVVLDQGAGHYHLDVIFIDPAYHSRGIGTQAMQFIEQTYPARRWTLDTPQWATRNQHFYEKLGYVPVGTHADDDTPLIAYEKRVM